MRARERVSRCSEQGSKSEYAYAGLSRTWRFLPSDSLITPSPVRFAGIQRHLLVGDGNVVDAQAAALDLAPRLAVGGNEARLDEGGEHADAGIKFAARNFHCRQVFGDRAFLKRLPRGLCGLLAASRPCSSAVASVASTFLASLISPPLSAASFSISPIGRIVNSLRNLTTSASSVLRQYCQKS